MPLDTLTTAETPEGISLSLRPAGLVPRMLAYGVDLLARFGLYIGISIASIAFGGMGTAALLVSLFLLEWFYPVFFELMPGSATPGKRVFGLHVVMDSGLPVTPAASITRNLLRAADFMPFLFGAGIASMLWHRDFKRLGDLAAGTLVVYCDSVELHGGMPPADPLPPARLLAPEEQSAIVAWASRASRLTPARTDELALLARAAAPGQGGDATRLLLGVAHWLVGHRKDNNKEQP